LLEGRDKPLQFCAFTEIVPGELPQWTVTWVVPYPEVIVQPVGTVQEYEVAFGTAQMEKTTLVPW